jgi:hypothetical protein
MVAVPKDEQVEALAPLLKPLGFKKRRVTWHRATADAIHTINIQGSQWGPEYYLNVGTYLRALGHETTPPGHRCHIQSRIHPPDRPAEVLAQECQDWFMKFGTIPSLIAHFKSGSLPLATNGAAKEWLSAA